MFSALGGLAASINLMLGIVGAWGIIEYTYSLSKMLKRKSKNRINKIMIKRIIEQHPHIEYEIEKK